MNVKNTRKEVLGVITARGGSKGIPGKNIKNLLGKPLIAWTIDTAKKSTLITDLIVSTDDEEIARVAKEWGANVPFMRPKELAEDKTPHLPVMQHALREMERMTEKTYDAVVVLQPTSPYRTVEDLDATIQKLLDTPEADSAVSMMQVESKAHPMKIKKMENGRVLAYSVEETQGIRRQDLAKAYRRSGDAYVMTRKCILEKDSLYGEVTVGYEVDASRCVDIDVPMDWVIAEIIGRKLFSLDT